MRFCLEELAVSTQSFTDFEAVSRSQGFDEVLERVWAPSAQTGTHTHPFSVAALVTRGEMWLTVGDDVRHLCAGDRFTLDRNIPHAERYGADGAVLWVARRGDARRP